jgi:hypothetical protein
MSFHPAERQAPLVQLLLDLVERLLAEVGDGQEVVLALAQQLAHGVHLGPLEAVAGTLGEVEVFDGGLQLGRRGHGGAGLPELEGGGLLAHLGDERHQLGERVTGRRQRVARGDRTVGLDVEHEAVVVGVHLHAGGLHQEGDAPHGREDGVDGDHTDGVVALVAVGRQVATAPLHGEVQGQPGLLVEGGQVVPGVEHLDVGGGLDVGPGDVGRAPQVDAQGDGLVGDRGEHEVLEVQDDVGDILGDPVDGAELVQGVIESDGRDGGAGDRRQERAAQRVAERVAEAGLERADREALTVVLLFADGLDRGTLNDQHVKSSSGVRGRLLGVELDDELLAHGHVDLLAGGQVAHRDLEAVVADLQPGRLQPVEGVEVVADHDHLARLVAQ